MKKALFVLAFGCVAFGWMQPAAASPPDEFVSGLLHQPLGGISSFSVTDRRLSACCLGSSGEDGVEIRLDSVFGGGAAVDLHELQTPSPVAREIRIRPRGWDGTIKGSCRLIGNPDGSITEVQDYSDIAATSIRWRALDMEGRLLAKGEVPGPVITYGIAGFDSAKFVSYARSAAGIVENKNVDLDFFTVTGLGGMTLDNVHEFIVTPQVCEGCSPPWTDVASMLITGEGISALIVENAHLQSFGVQSWGLGAAHLAELCPIPGVPCDPPDRQLRADNLGSSGQDGVAIDFGPGSAGGEVARGRCSGCPFGHVILMKAFDDGGQELGQVIETANPATGQGVLIPDFSAVGSTEFDVAYIGTDGTALAVERCGNGTPLEIPNAELACSSSGHTWSFDAEGEVMELTFCAPAGSVTLPSGMSVPNPIRLKLRRLWPTLFNRGARRVELTSPDAGLIIVEHASASRAVFASGLPHVALGDVSTLAVDGRSVTACCLGSSGEDGVEVGLDSVAGGTVHVDATPLLGATGTHREIRIRPKGWDGTIKGNLRLSSDPNGQLTEEYDFSPIGATALHWRLRNAHGGVLAEGDVAGPVITWSLDAGEAATLDKVFDFPPPDSAARSANQGFFDRVVSVSGLTPDAVAGVQSIEVTPVQPCAGCPNGPPWDDLRSLEISGDGLEDLVVSNAQVHTFHLPAWGVGQAHLSEVCADPLADCAPSDRRLAVHNLGSSGQDGVAISYGGGGSGGHIGHFNGGDISYSARCKGCSPGHVTLLKLYDDEGGEAFRAAQSENPLSGQVDVSVDSAGQGASHTVATFYDASSAVLASAVLDPATTIAYFACPADASTSQWSWTGSRYRLHACGGLSDYILPGGTMAGGVAFVEFAPEAPTLPRASSVAEITSSNPGGLLIESASSTPSAIGDVDRDGDIDLSDFAVLAQCLAGPGVPTHPPVCSTTHFRLSDLDSDVDVDLQDFSSLQQRLP